MSPSDVEVGEYDGGTSNSDGEGDPSSTNHEECGSGAKEASESTSGRFRV